MDNKQTRKMSCISQKKKYIDIINSYEYKKQLSDMASRIINCSKSAPNEATIESNFDCELFNFFRNTFSSLGFEYNPIKEKAVNTRRNVLKGRADTAIASLIIEFKQPKTLSNDKKKEAAINQITEYINSMSSETGDNYLGFVTDGVVGCFLQYVDDSINAEKFYTIDYKTLDRIIQCIVHVKLIVM